VCEWGWREGCGWRSIILYYFLGCKSDIIEWSYFVFNYECSMLRKLKTIIMRTVTIGGDNAPRSYGNEKIRHIVIPRHRGTK
jgi:hypothetical protein